MHSGYQLWLALAVQAGLLFTGLDLLPVWGDEQFTIDTAPQSPAAIWRIVEGDVHPPLYYLAVHAWLALPLPGDVVVRARALSGVFLLLALVAFDRLWLGRSEPSRPWILLLWTLSP
ncbi:MAG: hypothetical protein ACRD96_23720, partial [Bryobacteraceae bacterium]